MKKIAILAVIACFSFSAHAGTVVESPGGGKSSEWAVTNGAGGSTLTALSGRKAVELQNLGPNAIFCTVDGQAPTADSKLGRKIESGATWALNAADTVSIKCIAATAAQSTGAATLVTELR
jgi:hypothetical protein